MIHTQTSTFSFSCFPRPFLFLHVVLIYGSAVHRQQRMVSQIEGEHLTALTVSTSLTNNMMRLFYINVVSQLNLKCTTRTREFERRIKKEQTTETESPLIKVLYASLDVFWFRSFHLPLFFVFIYRIANSSSCRDFKHSNHLFVK